MPDNQEGDGGDREEGAAVVRLPVVQQGLAGGGEHHEHDARQTQRGDCPLCSLGNFEESSNISGIKQSSQWTLLQFQIYFPPNIEFIQEKIVCEENIEIPLIFWIWGITKNIIIIKYIFHNII